MAPGSTGAPQYPQGIGDGAQPSDPVPPAAGPPDATSKTHPPAGSGGHPAMDPYESAWRIHSALGDWTARVDAKASFALTLESVALAGLGALTGTNRFTKGLTGALRVPFYAGLALLLASALCAVLVVLPRVGGGQAAGERDFIYFGHLRHWDPALLQQALREQDPLPMLSRQLVVVSRIAWTKHRVAQLSFLLAFAALVLLAFALLLS